MGAGGGGGGLTFGEALDLRKKPRERRATAAKANGASAVASLAEAWGSAGLLLVALIAARKPHRRSR